MNVDATSLENHYYFDTLSVYYFWKKDISHSSCGRDLHLKSF